MAVPPLCVSGFVFLIYMFRVQGFVFLILGSCFRGFGFRFSGFGIQISGSGLQFWVRDFVFRDSSLGGSTGRQSRASHPFLPAHQGFRFQASGSGFRVSGSGCRMAFGSSLARV